MANAVPSIWGRNRIIEVSDEKTFTRLAQHNFLMLQEHTTVFHELIFKDRFLKVRIVGSSPKFQLIRQ